MDREGERAGGEEEVGVFGEVTGIDARDRGLDSGSNESINGVWCCDITQKTLYLTKTQT